MMAHGSKIGHQLLRFWVGCIGRMRMAIPCEYESMGWPLIQKSHLESIIHELTASPGYLVHDDRVIPGISDKKEDCKHHDAKSSVERHCDCLVKDFGMFSLLWRRRWRKMGVVEGGVSRGGSRGGFGGWG